MTTQHIVHQILLTTSLWTDFLDVSGNGCRGRQEEGRRLESGRRRDSHHHLCASLAIFRCHALFTDLSPTGMDWSNFCCSQSQRWSLCQDRASNRTHRTPLVIYTSRIYTRLSPTQTSLMFRALSLRLHPHYPHQTMRFGLTHFDS